MSGNNEQLVLPNELVENVLNNIAKEYLKSSNYKKIIEKGSSKGDNYLGILFRVHLETDCNKSDESGNNNINQNKISVIVKLPPQNEARRKQFFARPAFLREALVYNEILPMLINFQKSKGVTDGFNHVPHCYATLTVDKCEGIFLEDLGQQGYIMFNRLKDIDIDHAKLVIKALGKLHAVSFAMKDKEPEIIAKYKSLSDIIGSRAGDEQFANFLDDIKGRSLLSLKSPKDQFLINKLNQFIGNNRFLDIMEKLVDGKQAEPYAVLCHGDCWNNNVLYKYKDEKPIDARLIDWQITRYASPVCDLMYFLFCCTTKDFRDKHYYDLMSLYHNELSNLLRRLGSNPDQLFPRNVLDQQLKKFGSFGLLMAMLVLPFILSNVEDVPDLDEMAEKLQDGTHDSSETFKSENTKTLYVERMKGVIVDMVNFGYI